MNRMRTGKGIAFAETAQEYCFPVKPTDPAPVKVMKHSAFGLFAGWVMLISLGCSRCFCHGSVVI